MPSKKVYWKDPEKFRAKADVYRRTHTDWKREANRAWLAEKRKNNPEWAKANDAKYRALMTAEQKLERAAYQRKWFEEHPHYSRQKQMEDHLRHPQKRMVEAAKVRAVRVGVPFDLDWRKIEVPVICPVLGIPLVSAGKLHPNSPTIDRLIPALGYVHSNVRVISMSANAIKKAKSLDDMRDYVARLEEQLKQAKAVLWYMRVALGEP